MRTEPPAPLSSGKGGLSRGFPLDDRFFLELRQAGLPVTLTEFLTLLEALNQRVTAHDIDEFYYLARATLVKDERHSIASIRYSAATSRDW